MNVIIDFKLKVNNVIFMKTLQKNIYKIICLWDQYNS